MSEEPSKRPAPCGDFLLGEWVVHPTLDRLSRGDAVVHLRPQLTDLLVVLARHAGQTVSKEAILREVWGTLFVGESVLTRCVTELRQTLHDAARAPKLLETIPKRGYRLVAPVVFLADLGQRQGDGGGGAAPEPPATATDGAAAAPSSPAVPDRAAGMDADRFPRGSVVSRAGPLLRRTRWTGVKVAIIAGVAVAVGAGDWHGRPVTCERNSVLLADVTNATGNRVFDDTLRLALAVNLEQAPFLRILPQCSVRAALVRMGRSPNERVVGQLALDVCRREGAAVVLAGSIAPLGSRYAVGLEALACTTGESVGHAIGEARDKDHVLGVLDQVATRIRLKLDESRSSLRQSSIPLVQATTASLDALEALTLGDESRDHGHVADALRFYRQATELDPRFALAWARLGAASRTLELPEESAAAIGRAYELREKVSQPERFYIEAHYYTFVASDPQKAIDTYRAWKRTYPGSLVPTTNLASLLSGFLGEYEAAVVEAREAVRLGPYSSIARGTLARAYLGAGRIAEARQVIAEAAKAGISDRIVHHYSLGLALFDDDREALEREIQWAAGDPPAALQTLATRAAAAMAGGRLREARALWSEALARAREIGPASLVARTRLAWAEAEALVGDARLARTSAGAAIAEDRGATTLVDAAAVFALAGDAARARSILASVPIGAGFDPGAVLVGLPLARALVESAAGQDASALAVLQSVIPFEQGYEFGAAPQGVRALLALSAHRPAEAVAALDSLIRSRVRYPASAWVPYARLALARALRQAGDRTRGLAVCDEFLQSWKGADRDAPLLVAAQGERAALSR